MAVSNASDEDIALRRRRVTYRAWHRGTLEMDMILGNFADAHVEGFDNSELDRLERLMEEQDTDLLKWVMGQEPPPESVDKEFLQQVIEFQTGRLNRQ